MKTARRLLVCACACLAAGVLAIAACQAMRLLPMEDELLNLTAMTCLYGVLACLFILLVLAARRYWREILLVTVSVMLSLAALDLALARIRPEFTCMPYRQMRCARFHHRLPPSTTQYMTSENGVVFATTNEDGLRSPYSRQQFLNHKKRIAILGDSFTYGVLVPGNKTFCAATESLLRERLNDPDIAVLNAGIVSYSPYTENLLFEKTVRAYEPQVVVVFLDATDFGDDYWYRKQAVVTDNGVRFERKPAAFIPHYCALQEFTRPFSDCLLQHAFYPAQYRRLRTQQWVPETDIQLHIDGQLETNRYFIYRHPLESIRPFLEETTRNIDRLYEQVRAAGAAFALVVYPRFHLWNIKEAPDAWDKSLYKLQEPYQYEYLRYFGEIKANKPYSIIDMLPAFQATTEFPLCFKADAHWNARGHRFVADFLTNYLIESGLLAVCKKSEI